MSRHPVLPISLHVAGRDVLLIGEGPGARRRQRQLVAAGARVRRVRRPDYRAELCTGAFAVFAHSADEAFNRRAVADGRQAGCLSYAHDDPGGSDFSMPAIVRRGALTIAVSTAAMAPALSARIRQQLQVLFDAAAEPLERLIGDLARRRSTVPAARRGQKLARLAACLRIEGRVVVESGGE